MAEHLRHADSESGRDILELEAESPSLALAELSREYVGAFGNGDLYIADFIIEEMCAVGERFVDCAVAERLAYSERGVQARVQEVVRSIVGAVRDAGGEAAALGHLQETLSSLFDARRRRAEL